MRKEFEMSDEQRERILDASKPTPVMAVSNSSGGSPIPIGGSPQENANRAWKALAEELGFVWDSARPVPGKSDRYFTAEVVE